MNRHILRHLEILQKEIMLQSKRKKWITMRYDTTILGNFTEGDYATK
jgi:hypothetical protein